MRGLREVLLSLRSRGRRGILDAWSPKMMTTINGGADPLPPRKEQPSVGMFAAVAVAEDDIVHDPVVWDVG